MMTMIVVLLIAMLIVLLRSTSERSRQMSQLHDAIADLFGEVKRIRLDLPVMRVPAPSPAPVLVPERKQSAFLQPPPAQTSRPEPVVEEPMPFPPPQAPPPPPIQPEPLPQPQPAPQPLAATLPPPIAVAAFESLPPLPPRVPASPVESYEPEDSFVTRWLRNNPDLEKFIGENLINKIGIAVLVLGIAFFVKYAIDQNWISETGRVAIGLGCGAILAGIAHRLRVAYRAFSSVLAGGGIVVFYFTIAFAYQQYTLIGQAAAFSIMVVITLLAVALAILYDRLELAVIAIVGGFLTPFLVSRGAGAYPVLFTYLIILNTGMLLLAFYKRWTSINVLSLLFTVLIYGGFLLSGKPYAPVTVLLFGGVYYGLFLAMNMAYPLRRKAPFRAPDFSILISITALYYAAGMGILHDYAGGKFDGLFTLAMGLINLGLGAWLFLRQKADRVLLYLVLGLTLTFITLAIPVQLHGHTITMFWSAEFVLLYWLWQRSRIRVFEYSAMVVCFLSICSLLMDWQIAGSANQNGIALMFIDVQGLVTNLVAVAAFGMVSVLLRKERSATEGLMLVDVRADRYAAIIAVALLYLTAVFSINLVLRSESLFAVPDAYHRLITLLFVATLLLVGRRNDNPARLRLRLTMVILAFLYYFANGMEIALLRNGSIAGFVHNGHVAAHWAGFALLLLCCYLAKRMITAQREVFESRFPLLTTGASLLLVLLFSLEGANIYLLLAAGNPELIGGLLDQYNKAPLTILWGMCSFVLMWLGMRHSNKPARIVSLSLFSLALLKLFLLDIRGLSEGGRILAFILLGVLLLTVSFMYQKLKRLLLHDQNAEGDAKV